MDVRSFDKFGRDKKGEIYSSIKFWRYSDITQEFELATQVTAPHDRVTSISSCATSGRVVTTGSEGKFAIWEKISLAHAEEENYIDESWRCRSVGYYRDQCASTSAFSTDGSLVAITYGTTITLWDPATIVLKRTLQFSHSDYSLEHLQFISNAPFLVAASKSHLYVWNLLNLQVHWFSEFTLVHSIAVDPVLPQFAVLMSSLPNMNSVLLPPNARPFQFPDKFVEVLKLPESVNKTLKAQKNHRAKKKKKSAIATG